MARLNVKTPPIYTHEGGKAAHITAEQQLRRTVMSCLLWEDEFYEDGETISDRITALAQTVRPEIVAQIAIEARELMHLRHVPLILLEALSKVAPHITAETVARVIKRADEPAELLAILWRNGRKMIPRQMRIGIGNALRKFDEYQLAKYDRDGAIKLRDVLRMVRPKPETVAQSLLWSRAKNRTLDSPDTWEVALSGGADKKQTFERLLSEGKLGYFALLRNLRNMDQAGVDEALIRNALIARQNGAQHVLPFRYVAAARACPRFEPFIDRALGLAIEEMEPFSGLTAILVDVSGSMSAKLSGKSDLSRMDAAAALASIFPGQVRVFSFADALVECPPRKGMAGVDAIERSQYHGGTRLADALRALNQNVPYNRVIVITDEQSADSVINPLAMVKHAYMINVASHENGVGYGRWTHIDGFSENVFRFIRGYEALND